MFRKLPGMSLLWLRTTTAAFLVGCLAFAPWNSANATGREFFVIAHMANSKEAIDWAITQGANAIEADLNFHEGKPTDFRHGFPCECTPGLLCLHGRDSICRNGSSCRASMAAADLLRHVARQAQLALLVIDSKPHAQERMSEAEQEVAGREVVELLGRELFQNGYAGKVIVSVAEMEPSTTYLRAAAATAAGKSFADQLYFSFDQEGNKVKQVLTALRDLPSKARAFGTGISACWFEREDYARGIRLAQKNKTAGAASFVYIWTIDKRSSMERYIEAGAQGIMTNVPGRLRQLIKDRGGTLATSKTPMPMATSDAVVD